MCGRFVSRGPADRLLAAFPIDRVEAEVSDDFNVAPTCQVLAITRRGGANVLERLQWGLVPFWARDPAIGSRLINARAETAASKPAFRSALKKRRCLILADGFYEWEGEQDRKQPLFITLPDGKPFAFAGLWETWFGREQACEALRSCAILTTAASPSLSAIHPRMPVILKSPLYRSWLDPEFEAVDLDGILKEGIHLDFVFHPVSKAVNSARNNSPRLIEEEKTEGQVFRASNLGENA